MADGFGSRLNGAFSRAASDSALAGDRTARQEETLRVLRGGSEQAARDELATLTSGTTVDHALTPLAVAIGGGIGYAVQSMHNWAPWGGRLPGSAIGVAAVSLAVGLVALRKSPWAVRNALVAGGSSAVGGGLLAQARGA